MSERRFIMLDRDGVIIEERNYLADYRDVVLLPNVAHGMRLMQEMGLGLVIITNQSGIGRGYFSLNDLEAIHHHLFELLARNGVVVDGLYFCPHHPDTACRCRKPLPGMVEEAAAALHFDPRHGFLAGDKPCDIELAQAVGARSFLVRTGYGATHEAAGTLHPDYCVNDLCEMATIVQGHIERL